MAGPQDALLRLKLQSMTNHELRELLVGLWARLDAADRVGHIRELRSYHTDREGWLSDVASSIARAVAGENAIDLREVARFHQRDLP